MHIPDGLIPYWQAGIYYLIAIVFWAISFKKVSEELSEKQIPLLGILAAGL
ncbi:MAG: energy-coupling factor ABC transporter permease, partial [Candidatus Wukongarchaeota archaeon]